MVPPHPDPLPSSGLAHAIAIICFATQLARAYGGACSRYKLGDGGLLLVLQLVAALLCALIPVLELNGRLGETIDSDAGPAPHEYAGTRSGRGVTLPCRGACTALHVRAASR